MKRSMNLRNKPVLPPTFAPICAPTFKPAARALCGVLLVASACFALPAHALPVVSIVPATSTVLAGQSFSVAVDVSGIANLFAYNLSLNYDASVVRFVSATEGGFLGHVGSTFFISGTDNGAGRLAYAGDSLTGGGSGATGSGALLYLLFEGRSGGNAMFSLSDMIFLTPMLGDIAVQAGTAAVKVMPVPEPSGIALSLLASLALLTTRAGMRSCIARIAPRWNTHHA
jgi:hypothetical protein